MADAPEKYLTQQEKDFLSAAHMGNAAKLSELLEAGVNVDVTDKENSGAIHAVTYQGYTDALKVLLAHHPKLEVRTVTGLTPLELAGMHKQEAAGLLLVEAGADPNYPDGNGSIPLENAAHHDMVAFAKALIARGSKVEAGVPGKKSPAILASMGGSVEILKMLEAKGANLQYTDEQGHTPLSVSVWKQPAFEYLLSRTTAAQLQKEAKQVVIAASYTNNRALFRQLLARGIKVTDYEYEPPLLHNVAYLNLAHSAQELLQQGVKLDARDKSGKTAREEAATKGKNEAVISVLDAWQHRLDVQEIVATVQKGVGKDTAAPEKASFRRKISPGRIP